MIRRWCPRGDLNPHDPFESADFKSDFSPFFGRTQNAISQCLRGFVRAYVCTKMHRFQVQVATKTATGDAADLPSEQSPQRRIQPYHSLFISIQRSKSVEVAQLAGFTSSTAASDNQITSDVFG